MYQARHDAVKPDAAGDECGGGLSRKALVLGGLGTLTLAAVAVATPFISPAFRRYCIPYVPATSGQIALVLDQIPNAKRAGVAPKLCDLGSGDGRVVIAAAQRGFDAVGYELNYWLVLWSRWRAWRAGVGRRARFYRADLWRTNLSQYDAVVVFGVAEMLAGLESKLAAELADDARVVACRFKLPTWAPYASIERSHLESVWAYRVPRVRASEPLDSAAHASPPPG